MNSSTGCLYDTAVFSEYIVCSVGCTDVYLIWVLNCVMWNMWHGLTKIVCHYWLTSIIPADAVIWGDQNENVKASSIY
jgi:hypothetical protein